MGEQLNAAIGNQSASSSVANSSSTTQGTGPSGATSGGSNGDSGWLELMDEVVHLVRRIHRSHAKTTKGGTRTNLKAVKTTDAIAKI
jgi:hypothetical protein